MDVAVDERRAAAVRPVVRTREDAGELAAGDLEVVQREGHHRRAAIRLEAGGDDIIAPGSDEN